jgi:hypothetical protein
MDSNLNLQCKYTVFIYFCQEENKQVTPESDVTCK